MSKLLEGKYKYANVQRWSKDFDIFLRNMIFFPVNIKGTHWTLVIAYMQLQQIRYLDAKGGKGEVYTKAVKKYIVDEKKAKKGITMTREEIAEWVIVPGSKDGTPQQENDDDCGMFVCMFADFLLENLPLQFTQEDIPALRLKICYSILKGKLLYSM
jgi:sentrin-specific protease 1